LKKAAKEPILMNVANKTAAKFMQTKTATQQSRDTYRGIIVAVVSNKGGAGSTTVATNIAIDLARQNRSVCLVDLVLRSGSVASFLNVEPTCCLLDIAKSLRRDRPLAIEDAFIQHISGLHVLAEPLRGALETRIKPADIDEILDRLVESFEFLVIDTPKVFDDMQLLALDRAEVILFVTEMDAPSLKGARQTFEHLRRMGVDIAKIRVLLNRYIPMETMDLGAIENLLGLSVFWTIPDDYRAVLSAVNQGLSVQACGYDSDIARSYGGLPDALIESISPSR
jgi:pilus assembly protein CpaE